MIKKSSNYANIFIYDSNYFEKKELFFLDKNFTLLNDKITWLNFIGFSQFDVELVSNSINIHPLITEDILTSQRPKVDEENNIIYCSLNWIHYNEIKDEIQTEQISLILSKNIVVAFQNNSSQDVFKEISFKLESSQSRIRTNKEDFLFYSLIDIIVDNYYITLDKIRNRIDILEKKLLEHQNKSMLTTIIKIRKELTVLKMNFLSVKDLIINLIHTSNPLINKHTLTYFKDIRDHIYQLIELNESYHEVILNLKDIYLGNANLKLNNIMKLMAIFTCIVAPANLISSIFGMNFKFNSFNSNYGFSFAVATMIFIITIMILYFKNKKWI